MRWNFAGSFQESIPIALHCSMTLKEKNYIPKMIYGRVTNDVTILLLYPLARGAHIEFCFPFISIESSIINL